MKKFYTALLTTFLAVSAVPALANDVMVASTMQRCATNEDCTLISNSCADNCGFVPVNKANLGAVQTLYQSRCGKPMTANPQCNMNPPIAAACINARCTIDYAYANHAGAKDYQSGAYPVPEKAAPSKVQGDYTGVDDRNGQFNAYNLPAGTVKENTMGQIVTKVYVPPSAPVSGGNYVPVPGAAPIAQPAPAPAPAAVVPPAAVPKARSNATPATVTTTTTAPVYQPAPASAPQVPQTYVPAQTPPTIPAPGLPAATPVPRAPTQQPVAIAPAAAPAVGAPGVPQAPAGSTPIPPSDLKPAPTFVPPAGAAVPVAPEDPGAPPPPGTTMLMPLPDGDGTVKVGGDATGGNAKAAQKSFNAASKQQQYN